MRHFDPRVVPPPILSVLRRAQAVAPAHLGGGAALSGAHLAHRLSRDIDLFVHDRAAHRRLVTALPEIAESISATCTIQQDAGSFVRATLDAPGGPLLVDLVHEPADDLAPAEVIDEMLATNFSERQGRLIDHDEEGSMEKKKREGYF